MTKTRGISLFLISFFLAHCSQLVFAEETCAKVAVLIGEAWTGNGTQLKVGQVLSKGVRLKTGPNSLVKLILADESILDLGSSSQLKLSDCQEKNWKLKINLELEKGSVRALVNKAPKKKREDFQLKTNTSVLAVRGTEFFVSWQQDARGQVSEQIGVVEGRVEVRSLFDDSSKPLSVVGGTEFRAEGLVQRVAGETKVESKAPPQIDQFTAQEQRQAEQNTKVESKVFESTVDLSGAKMEQSSKGEKVALFVNTSMQTSFPALARREMASESKPAGSADVQKVVGGSSVGGPPNQPGNGNPVAVSIPATVKWSVSNRE
ncbi:MAG: hypothetical protein EBQ92_12225 [Proteobacteria bacterium]|nr:hypothetical protein [Pseudomonadota bacterium]